MSPRVESILQTMQRSFDHWDAVIAQVDGRWETRVFEDGLQWTVRQLINHVADAEKGHMYQVTNIAKGKDVIPEDFDIERYNRRTTEKTVEKSAEESLQELTIARQHLTDWVYGLDDSKLDNKGRHASLQIMTVEEILKLNAAHTRDHADSIATALGISV